MDDKAVYARQCTSRHQPEGTGLSKTFPPLAGNPDLFIDRLFPVYMVLNGLEGPATIKGEHYQGAMPPFDHLSDVEVAAVIGYIRGAWNNDRLQTAGFGKVDTAAVAEARKKPMQAKARPFTPTARLISNATIRASIWGAAPRSPGFPSARPRMHLAGAPASAKFLPSRGILA